MPAANPTNSASQNSPPDGRWLSWATAVLLLGLAALFIANERGRFWEDPAWLAGTLVAAGFAASLAALAPPLATVNVLMAGGIAAGIGGIAVAISAVTGYPLGPLAFTPAAGPQIANLVPWWLPLIWASIALSSRGAARLLLHRQRENPYHGYRVIAAASGLAILSTLLLNHCATHDGRFWKPDPTGSLFVSSGHLLHLMIQVAITALLIDKLPGVPRANIRPLIVWLTLNATLLALWLVK